MHASDNSRMFVVFSESAVRWVCPSSETLKHSPFLLSLSSCSSRSERSPSTENSRKITLHVLTGLIKDKLGNIWSTVETDSWIRTRRIELLDWHEADLQTAVACRGGGGGGGVHQDWQDLSSHRQADWKMRVLQSCCTCSLLGQLQQD